MGKKKKKMHREELSLFPDIEPIHEHNGDSIIKDELNISEYPIALLVKRSLNNKNKNRITVYADSSREWTLIGNPELGGLPLAHDLDYFHALLDILHEQIGNSKNNTIYFTVYQLIIRAGKKYNKQEYKRALSALMKYQGLIIDSKAYKSFDKKDSKVKIINKKVSIIQESSIIGNLKKGRKYKMENSQDGYYKIVFSEDFLRNLRSQELSKNLNYSFMMRLDTSLGKRYFRLIDFWRYMECKNSTDGNKTMTVRKDIKEVANLLPLIGNHYPSVIRRSLEPVHKELKNLRYLKDVIYENDEENKMCVCYVFSDLSAGQAYAINELVSRKVTESVANMLVLRYGPQKIIDAIKYCYYKAKEQSISPGYLVELIKTAEHDSLKHYIGQQQENEEARRSEYLKNKERQRLQMLYEQDIETQIDNILRKLSDNEMNHLKKVAESKFSFNLFSNEKTKILALDGIIRDMIKGQHKLLTFEEWCKKSIENNQLICRNK